MDIGSGDARAPLRWARADPGRLFIAVDANASGMVAVARKAARKPARGGVRNLLCVVAAAEVLPGPLRGVADRLTVLLPWGSLLRAFVAPEPALLRRARALCQPGAGLELVFSHEPGRDGARRAPVMAGEGALDDAHVHGLARPYRDAGFAIDSVERLPVESLRAYPTTWAKRLGYGQARAVYRVRATAEAGAGSGADGTELA